MKKSPIRKRSRNRAEVDKSLAVFRKLVLQRDGFKCVLCKAQAEAVHHIWGRRVAPHLIDCVRTGIALCNRCHTGREGVHERVVFGHARIAVAIGIDAWDELFYLSFQTGKGKS